MCFYFPVTSITGKDLPKDMCVNDGLYEDPANCRNYYWCQVNIRGTSRIHFSDK